MVSCSDEHDGGGATAEADKLLIEIGRDAPTPDHVRSNITEMERQPFNGLMVDLNAGKTIFNEQPYPDSAFEQDREDLAATEFTTLTDNFITVWSAREEGWDWFDDADWASAEQNAANFARTAKAGRFKGFMFDPEPYGTNPWSYDTTLYPSASFEAVQAKVRQRGASFLEAVQSEMPDVTILMLFGVSIVQAQAAESGSVQTAEWALLASFVDGMLDVINPQAVLIDGNEGSYYYTSAEDFDRRAGERQSAREFVSPENRAMYDRQVSHANAVFADGLLDLLESPRFFGYYVDTDAHRQQLLEHLAYHALRTSDRYVWVYNENMDWWATFGAGVAVPPGLADSLTGASQAVEAGRPAPVDISGFMPAAVNAFDSKITIAGRVTDNGEGLEGVALTTAEPMISGGDPSCSTSDSEGYFGCTVPAGWSGTITPIKDGVSFTPPRLEVIDQTSNIDDADIAADTT